jgi:hypothetical protein
MGGDLRSYNRPPLRIDDLQSLHFLTIPFPLQKGRHGNVFAFQDKNVCEGMPLLVLVPLTQQIG